MLIEKSPQFSLTIGAWKLAFIETDAVLHLVHEEGDVRIIGSLSFCSSGIEWSVVCPRDAVQNRLAILDITGNIQGYITFQGESGRLSFLVHHRSAQNFSGELTFNGQVVFTSDSFSCRTQPSDNGRVIQLASGKAESNLNDSLFDPELDVALLLRSCHTKISAQEDGSFGLRISGKIEDPVESIWSFSFERDYYKSRYVPYYRPINRVRCPSPPTGWMSWNTYFDQATAEDNLEEARIGKIFLQPFGMEFWSIESWQDNSDSLPVSHFDNMSLKSSPRKFPDGMKRLAGDIRALGFRPGIWIPPFGTGSESFYQEHKDWFLHDRLGKPMSSWNGTYTIDPSQDEVMEYLKGIFRTASTDWGYEFFKIDGMSGRDHGLCAHFFERPDVKAAFKNDCANPFARCIAAFREGIGENRVFLACQGHSSGAEAAFADAARTGADIVHPNQPPLWENLQNQARCTLNQIFTHNIAFYSDPDTLLVGEFLDIEQARLATTVVSLPGQMMFSGDKLAKLSPERMRLLQQSLPVCDVRPLDLYPVFRMLPVWDLKVSRSFANWDVVALFNWSEKEESIGFDYNELGLDIENEYALYEFWTKSYLGKSKNHFGMMVPSHSVRLLAVHRIQPHPQFISSDRHILQGAVELSNLLWDSLHNRLIGSVMMVKNHPMTLRFLLPAGFNFSTATSTPEVDCTFDLESSVLLAVTLCCAHSTLVPFTLDFINQA